MFIGWLTCIQRSLLPHSLCRSTTANAPANRQMPIASVVRRQCEKGKTMCAKCKTIRHRERELKKSDYREQIKNKFHEKIIY